MGATNPAEAAEGTIRKLYAKSVGENSVHGSDAAATAAEEIPQFFSEDDIVGWIEISLLNVTSGSGNYELRIEALLSKLILLVTFLAKSFNLSDNQPSKK